MGELKGGIHFTSLSFTSTDSPVEVKSVFAKHAEITTTNGLIEGEFHTTVSLALTTMNGHIKANASLYDDMLDGAPVSLVMKSSNGQIQSGIHLRSSSSTRSAFNISARSTHGDLHIDLDESPLDARLDLYARTSNASATVSMSREFEGSYRLQTTNALAAILLINAQRIHRACTVCGISLWRAIVALRKASFRGTRLLARMDMISYKLRMLRRL
ncbi:hypothetical protein WOLCODRAFT_166418 [Wolfiporia cocos MD-104 SS10]|uniref:DUF7330 domain-containing protein n=1 Tax=Wolfiporia cocos (strain MD-104) TaxID=742152 RepID=A0A2H3J0D2_WOLCO|nr:hypothetical protein WOLCODRAFT_166418 [Wolfiporia cocos MD-104 SS10]